MKIIFNFLTFTLLSIFTLAANPKDYAKYVDTRIGTEGSGLGCGFTFVAATYPFGMVQFGPSFFSPQKGIVINQMSGAGCPNMGNFPTIPIAGRLSESPNDMNKFPKYKELTNTSAGQLSAVMPDGVKYDATASKRSAIARFFFPNSSSENTVIIGSGVNATYIDNAFIRITSASTCEGFADGGEFCGSPTRYKVYFAAEFNKEATILGTWINSDKYDGVLTAGGKNTGAYFTFNTEDGEPIEYKIAISYVSIENARENLKLDNAKRDFEQVKEDCVESWNDYLGVIDVEGESEDRKTQFYTALYHSLLHPNVFNDVNGEYIGSDFQIYKLPKGKDAYTTWSGWDTYRTQSQLIAMLYPKEASMMMESCVNFADQTGGYGRWIAANIETGIMHGDPIPIIIANTYAFGARDFDLERAYKHMINGATKVGLLSQNVTVRPGLMNYINNGFENASLCLEYTSADYAIGKFAINAIGDKKQGEELIERANNWKNLFDPSTNWLRSRWAHDGNWKDPDHDWREATKVNYFWMVPYDLETLIDTIGGKKVASDRLDQLFVRLDASYEEQHFAAGNEPNFLAPWVYNWTDRPYMASNVIHRIFNELYTSKPDGLPGNDDCGAMGAWYVFASIGLYPVIPGDAGFAFNAPQFEKITIKLGNGNLVEINGGGMDKYIHSIKLDGKRYKSTWLDWADISNGAEIDFVTKSKPNTKWGL